MTTLSEPSLQSRFMAFASSPEGASLPPLEAKSLLCLYGAANPDGTVQLPILRIAKAIAKPDKPHGKLIQGICAAVDSLTAKGVIETVTASEKREDGSYTVAVRRLVFFSS